MRNSILSVSPHNFAIIKKKGVQNLIEQKCIDWTGDL